MSKKSASVKRIDVARLAGVSPSAVSLVLNNHPTTRISFATRERIRQVAKALGYYPNAVARALVTGKRNTVGIVLYFEQTPFDGYSSMILNGIWKAMSEWRMLIGAGDDTRGAAGFFLEKAVDGVFILVPPVRQNEEISALADADFPCVLIGSRLPYGRRMAYVDINNREVGRQATRYLLQSGHRRI
ncbi:MAG: LacI family transcriptional regulator, partial [Planctomycetota bacterium]|nr:LacI family transcriptional regulator [Planctomycetota bacterium]